jgi:hypothetical protein
MATGLEREGVQVPTKCPCQRSMNLMTCRRRSPSNRYAAHATSSLDALPKSGANSVEMIPHFKAARNPVVNGRTQAMQTLKALMV